MQSLRDTTLSTRGPYTYLEVIDELDLRNNCG
jgi:hypothetical protein